MAILQIGVAAAAAAVAVRLAPAHKLDCSVRWAAAMLLPLATPKLTLFLLLPLPLLLLLLLLTLQLLLWALPRGWSGIYVAAGVAVASALCPVAPSDAAAVAVAAVAAAGAVAVVSDMLQNIKGKKVSKSSFHSSIPQPPPQHVVSVLVSPIPNPVIGINTRRTRSQRARGALQSVKSASTSPGRTMKCTLIVPFHCPPAAATRTGGGAGLTSSACSELVRLS